MLKPLRKDSQSGFGPNVPKITCSAWKSLTFNVDPVVGVKDGDFPMLQSDQVSDSVHSCCAAIDADAPAIGDQTTNAYRWYVHLWKSLRAGAANACSENQDCVDAPPECCRLSKSLRFSKARW